jgi:ABC-type transport system substrate-binding protein
MDGFAKDAGFRVNAVTMDYPTEFVPKFRDGKGLHDGWASKVGSQGNGPPDAIGQLAYLYYSKGGANFYGLPPDSYVDAQVERGLAEFDLEKRRQLAFDLERYLAEKQFYVNYPGGATGFNIAWPVIQNFNTYRGWADGRRSLFWWLDDTQPPLKKT